MSQIIENWSELRGVVESKAPEASGFVDVGVRVEEASAVPGYPHLVSEGPGQLINVRFRADRAPVPDVGEEIQCLVRKAGPDRFYAR